jgi:hypothetical protein
MKIYVTVGLLSLAFAAVTADETTTGITTETTTETITETNTGLSNRLYCSCTVFRDTNIFN